MCLCVLFRRHSKVTSIAAGGVGDMLAVPARGWIAPITACPARPRVHWHWQSHRTGDGIPSLGALVRPPPPPSVLVSGPIDSSDCRCCWSVLCCCLSVVVGTVLIKRIARRRRQLYTYSTYFTLAQSRRVRASVPPPARVPFKMLDKHTHTHVSQCVCRCCRETGYRKGPCTTRRDATVRTTSARARILTQILTIATRARARMCACACLSAA